MISADDLSRVKGWRARFEAAIDEIKSKPFDWKDNECVVGLCAKVTLAITGVDLAAQYRGTFDSAETAYKVMRRAGFDNLADLVASFLPEYAEGPCRAKIGDIVAIPMDSKFKFALGVVNGERVFVLMPDGIGTVDLLDAKRAFMVG